MREPWHRLAFPIALTLCLLTACANTHPLPRVIPVTGKMYPAASRRLGEEGRVLVEFHLDERRRPRGVTILQQDPKKVSWANGEGRLGDAAIRAMYEGIYFDPSDHTKPDPKHAYRVTIIFCLEPGHCGTLSPFPGTDSIVVKSQPVQSPDHEVITP